MLEMEILMVVIMAVVVMTPVDNVDNDGCT